MKNSTKEKEKIAAWCREQGIANRADFYKWLYKHELVKLLEELDEDTVIDVSSVGALSFAKESDDERYLFEPLGIVDMIFCKLEFWDENEDE